MRTAIGKPAVLTLSLLLSLFSASLCFSAEDLKSIRFGVADVGLGGKPVAGGAIINLVHVKGLLEEEFRKDGIKVEWNYFKGAGPAVNEAIANNQLDFAWQGDLPAIVARSGGLRTKLILASDKYSPTYLAVPPDSPAKTLEDLKGKKVAIFKGTNNQLAAIKAYESKGLTERDFKTINMDTATIQTALATKDVDGGWMGAQIFNLVNKGVAKILYSTKRQAINQIKQTHILVTEDFEKAHPQIVQRVVNVTLKEAAWSAEEKNRDETFQLWARSGVPYTTYERDNEGFPLRERYNPLIDELFVSHYKEAAESAYKFKLIRKPIEVDPWFEPKYLKQGLKDLKLEGVWQEYDAAGNPKGQK